MAMSIIDSIIILTPPIILGYTGARSGLIQPETSAALLKLVRKIFLPCLAFQVILSGLGPGFTHALWLLPLVGLYFCGLGFVSGTLFIPLLQVSEKKGNTFLYLMSAHNWELAIPLILISFGSPGLTVFFLVFPGFGLAELTFHQWIISQKAMLPRMRSFVIHPLFLTTVAAVLLSAGGAQSWIPAWLLKTTQIMGQGAAPCILFITGASLAGAGIKKDFRLISLLTVTRLVCFPALIIMSLMILSRFFAGISGLQFNVLLFIGIMPTLANPSSLEGTEGNIDSEFTTAAAVYTAIAAVIIIPVLFSIFGRF